MTAENTHRWVGIIAIRLVSGFTSSDSTASLHTNNHKLSFLVKSNLAKLETSYTVILPPTLSAPWWQLPSNKGHVEFELISSESRTTIRTKFWAELLASFLSHEASLSAGGKNEKNAKHRKQIPRQTKVTLNWRTKVSVTRLGDFLHFGQPFKACGNNYFALFAHILGTFCKGV